MDRQTPDVSEPRAPDKTDDDSRCSSFWCSIYSIITYPCRVMGDLPCFKATSISELTDILAHDYNTLDEDVTLHDELGEHIRIPSIHISPTHVEVVGGQSHTITCSVSNISVITDVTWIKTTADGDEIVNVAGVDGKFSGGTLSDHSLTINNIAKSDEGTYVCRATHSLGTTSSKHSVLTCKDNPFPVHTINQGRTNYARLGLVVVEIFQNILREVTRSNIAPDALHRQIRKQRKNNQSVFNKMTHEEHASLNTLTSRTYDNIDFTTLYKLIRSFSLLDDPTKGWGQPPTNADVTISDDVERLRCMRNKIVHRIKAVIDLIEMRNYFSNIVNITLRIDTYLGKIPDQGFTREVLNFQTFCMDAETGQKYYQALKDIEDIKEKFSKENVRFYYGKTFSNLIQDVKNKAKSSVIPISIVLEGINEDKKQMILNQLNQLKTEINSGQVNIQFKHAVSGSLIIYIDILDSNLLSTEHELGHQIYNFLCRALQLTRFNMKTENEITVVLIKEEDDIEVEFSIESDNWETYDEEISLRSNPLCLELDVNTEIFNTEQKMQSEFCLLVESVLGSNGKSNIESVSARLEPGIVDQNPCSPTSHDPTSHDRELDESFRPPHERDTHKRELDESFRPPHERDAHKRPPHERDSHKRPPHERDSHNILKTILLKTIRDSGVGPPHERDAHERDSGVVLENILSTEDEYDSSEDEYDSSEDGYGASGVDGELDESFPGLDERFLLHHERGDNTGPPHERDAHEILHHERGDNTDGRDVTLKDIGKTESEKPVADWHPVPPATSPPNPPI